MDESALPQLCGYLQQSLDPNPEVRRYVTLNHVCLPHHCCRGPLSPSRRDCDGCGGCHLVSALAALLATPGPGVFWHGGFELRAQIELCPLLLARTQRVAVPDGRVAPLLSPDDGVALPLAGRPPPPPPPPPPPRPPLPPSAVFSTSFLRAPARSRVPTRPFSTIHLFLKPKLHAGKPRRSSNR